MPSGADTLVADRARGIALGRLRLTVAPLGEDGLADRGRDRRRRARTPLPLARAGGRPAQPYRRGWARRAQVGRPSPPGGRRGAAARSIPLLTDSDGTVLEASRANVFLALDGALLTPAVDGRILPGIARLRAIEVAAEAGIEVREEAVSTRSPRSGRRGLPDRLGARRRAGLLGRRDPLRPRRAAQPADRRRPAAALVRRDRAGSRSSARSRATTRSARSVKLRRRLSSGSASGSGREATAALR